jgi:lipoate-protein ligase A
MLEQPFSGGSHRWRLLPAIEDSGYRQMAIDHALLESVGEGKAPPTLRFYSWRPPALTIGRFQSIRGIDLKACAHRGIEVVRRPTGGKAILHLHDFTYSIVLPLAQVLHPSVEESYLWICRGIMVSLRILGIPAELVARSIPSRDEREACFAVPAVADLACRGLKICGSAQVRKGGALLQHGSLMLREHRDILFSLFNYPSLRERKTRLEEYRRKCTDLEREGYSPSREEIAQAFIRGFEETFGIELSPGELSLEEKERAATLLGFYSSKAWTSRV